jgi:hypothetical protein
MQKNGPQICHKMAGWAGRKIQECKKVSKSAKSALCTCFRIFTVFCIVGFCSPPNRSLFGIFAGHCFACFLHLVGLPSARAVWAIQVSLKCPCTTASSTHEGHHITGRNYNAARCETACTTHPKSLQKKQKT